MLHRLAVCLFIFLSLVCAEAQQYPEKDFMPILREKGRFVYDRMPECWSSSEVWTVPDWRDEAWDGVMPAGVRCGRLTGMNYQGKPKRAGRSPMVGRRANWKKAVVTLSEGTIEMA